MAVNSFLLITSCLSWRVASGLGGLVGRMSFHLASRYRKRAVENASWALELENDPGTVNKMVKKVFENLGRSLFEFLYLQRFGCIRSLTKQRRQRHR